MSESHQWYPVQPQRGRPKWHLWRVNSGSLSICRHVDARVHNVLPPAPHRRFRVCQMCRRYAERNDIKLPKWAITPNRKRETP